MTKRDVTAKRIELGGGWYFEPWARLEEKRLYVLMDPTGTAYEGEWAEHDARRFAAAQRPAAPAGPAQASPSEYAPYQSGWDALDRDYEAAPAQVEDDDPYAQGVAAYKAGKSSSANPYPYDPREIAPGHWRHSHWMNGFDDAPYGDITPAPAQASPDDLCSDCPPIGYPTDITRCTPCPRRAAPAPERRDEWRPIETAPRDGSKVLLYAEAWEDTWGIQIGQYRFGEWETDEGSVKDNDPDFDPNAEVAEEDEADFDTNLGPTHWKPLPEPLACTTTTPAEG